MKAGSRPGAGESSENSRSPRLPVNFSLVVEGETAGGNPFKTHASAIKVSRTGATTVIDKEVSVGAHSVDPTIWWRVRSRRQRCLD